MKGKQGWVNIGARNTSTQITPIAFLLPEGAKKVMQCKRRNTVVSLMKSV